MQKQASEIAAMSRLLTQAFEANQDNAAEYAATTEAISELKEACAGLKEATDKTQEALTDLKQANDKTQSTLNGLIETAAEAEQTHNAAKTQTASKFDELKGRMLDLGRKIQQPAPSEPTIGQKCILASILS